MQLTRRSLAKQSTEQLPVLLAIALVSSTFANSSMSKLTFEFCRGCGKCTCLRKRLGKPLAAPAQAKKLAAPTPSQHSQSTQQAGNAYTRPKNHAAAAARVYALLSLSQHPFSKFPCRMLLELAVLLTLDNPGAGKLQRHAEHSLLYESFQDFAFRVAVVLESGIADRFPQGETSRCYVSPGSFHATAARAAKKAVASRAVIEKKVAQSKTTRVLALRECGLKALPLGATAADAALLRTADLSANLLRALPAEIGLWTGLQTLLCSENELTELPASIGQLACLQKLILSKNKLRTLPIEFSSLSKVKILQLDGNCLGPTLPAEIFRGLSGFLEELDLSTNRLEELPSSVAELGKLVRLVVAGNRLAALQPELGGLGKLQFLDAAENQLTAIPAALLAGPSLSELWLKGNPMDRLQLQETPGFSDFLQRRKHRLDAKISANVVGHVDLTLCGLD
ncbi:unnamed protein product [Polarella glacialis]|uniref:Uncharacterized protein n=1 Tax=Polarella glacialis TaxID=89957 RepID=A0A813GS85_POLGL|nr:unnamed protein product [Polarella glacialis]